MIVSVFCDCLKKKNGCFFNVLSVEDYILLSKDGCIQICYCRLDLWWNDCILYQVIIKGLIWFEVYEVYLEIGDLFDWYL